MKNIKQYAEEMRTMASLLGEAADALDSYHDEQLRGVLSAMGLSVPASMAPAQPAPEPAVTDSGAAIAAKIRKEYAQLPPIQRSLESRLYLARKYTMTEKQVSDLLQGPVQNGALTRK